MDKLRTRAWTLPDTGYRYGSAWLKEPLPQSVIDFLTSLPDTDRTPCVGLTLTRSTHMHNHREPQAHPKQSKGSV